jgi:hypothetical protein
MPIRLGDKGVVALSELALGKIETFYGADQTFITQTVGTVAQLPDGRMWEMVSPPQKEGALLGSISEGLLQASADGNAFSDWSLFQPAEAGPPGSNFEVPTYFGRGSGGWVSKVVDPPHNSSTAAPVGNGNEYRFFSTDFSTAIVQPFGDFTQLSPEATESTSYLRTLYLNGNPGEPCVSGCYKPLVSPANVSLSAKFGEEPDLTGAAYLAAQNANPFGSLVALYIVAQDPVSGTLIKVAGEVKPDPVTGQLVSTFKNTPQLPFEDLKLHFFGGSRAPLNTPAFCGSYTTSSSIAPWSGNPPAEPSSEIQILQGPNGTPCASPLPFSPSLTAGSTNIQTGAFSPFTMTMSREDGQQNLQSVQLHMPPGLLGTLATVKLCGEAEANAGTCGPESLIGETIVSVGLGGTPFSVKGGRVYITGPYHGAPYGLSIVNPAKAGPFDLSQVIVRAKIEVDPITAALTVTTDSSGPYAIPQILDGIPLQIKHINVTINRPNFTFNPTNCAPTAITGSLTSNQGVVGALSVPFQVTNCAVLVFKPLFKVSTAGKTSRAKGASLDVKLSYPKAPWGTSANIKSVKVDLPKQLPSVDL